MLNANKFENLGKIDTSLEKKLFGKKQKVRIFL